MNGQYRSAGSRGAARAAGLWVAAVFVLLLGIALMIVAVNRQPPLVSTTEVLPAPTVALPAMPPSMPAAGQLPGGSQMPPSGQYAGMPQQPGAMPGALPPGGMPAGMPGAMPPGAGGMTAMPAPPPTAVPTPTPTPPIADTFACRGELEFKVEPEEAVVTINGEVIGRARLYGEDEAFELPGPGTYYVRISSPGYTSYWCKVNVTPDAEKKSKKIKVTLSKDDD